MLLGKPWLRDAKVTHDGGSNVITIQGNGIVTTILVNKELGAKIRRPQVLVCYDVLEGLIDGEEDLIFETKPKLFLISTTIISYETISLLSIRMSEITISEEFEPKQGTSNKKVVEVVA
jgi:hypothetical protein